MNTSLIVIGFLNTSIVATGLKRFPNPGEHIYGKELIICPGGKSRNIAAMAGHLMGKGRVAMVGRTTRDQYGLWKAPLDALGDAGVNTDHVVIDEKTEKFSSIALIAVDERGSNQIIALPGIGEEFSKEDIDGATPLFEEAAKNGGYLALTLQCPLETAGYAINKAKEAGLRIVFDPGGIEESMQLDTLLDGLFLIKPNEHEAKMLTGIAVTDFGSAQLAAQRLMGLGAENVLITVGAAGAYLFTPYGQKCIPIPSVQETIMKNETGCGDQSMATLCAHLQTGASIEKASEIAVLAGTLQFHKQGIQPITKIELEAAQRYAYSAGTKLPSARMAVSQAGTI